MLYYLIVGLIAGFYLHQTTLNVGSLRLNHDFVTKLILETLMRNNIK